jgi:hypothetical protein
MSNPKSYTKNELVLDPFSPWNQAHNDEPLLIIRAEDWKIAVFLAALQTNNDKTVHYLNSAEALKRWHDDNDIPF